ncbi:hypothetical protein XENTR_v10014691 [Xenopus tropicalis]|nr:hypothetical protein XENTR_v10014691 [Xenopus tropicalis]KAE8604378.1 hypothetical protein XENTR_v10014691 [Xenopus tropicalis]
MGPARLYSFIIFLEIFLLFFGTTSAVNVENFSLFKPKLILKAHTTNIIPCAFHTRRPLNPLKVQLEWGVIPTGERDYKPLVHLFGDHVNTASPELNEKYKLFIPLVAKGNCSLVINPTNIEDSGTYQVKLIIKEKVYEPLSSIKIKVVDHPKAKSRAAKPMKEATAIIPAETTKAPNTNAPKENDDDVISDVILPLLKGHEMAFGIAVISIIIGLAAWSLIGLIICIRYCQRNKKGHTGDVENPS